MNPDEKVHSVGNLNATGENNGESEKDSKDCSNGSDGKSVNPDENVFFIFQFNKIL